MATKKFNFADFFDFDTLGKNLDETEKQFKEMDETLKKLAKSSNIKLVGDVKDIKANNKEIEKLLALTKKKADNDKQLLKIQKQKANVNKLNINQDKDLLKAEQEKIKQKKILNNVVNEELNKEERLNAQLEISKSKQKEFTLTLGKTSKAYSIQTKKTDELKLKLKLLTKERKLNEKVNKSAADSLDQLRAKSALLTMQISKLSKAERENSAEGIKLTEDLAEANEQLINFGKETNNGKDNVGRYSEGIISAAGSLNGFSDSLGEVSAAGQVFSSILNKTKADFGRANESQTRFQKGTKKTTAGLKGLLAGGTAAAILLIGTYFMKSAEGAGQLEIKITQLKLAAKTFIGFIAKAGGALFKKVEIWSLSSKRLVLDMKKSMIDAASSVKELFGGAPVQTDELDKKIKEANDNINKLEKEVNDVSFDEFKEDLAEAFTEGEKLGKMIINMRVMRRELELSSSELEKQLSLFIAIGEDDTKNFERRKKAQEEAIKLNKQLADERLAFAKMEIEAAEISLKVAEKAGLERTQEEEALKDAKIGLIQAESEYMQTVRDNAELRNKLLSDEGELTLDILNDGYDTRKTINEKIIADQKRTVEERQKLLDETTKQGVDVYKQLEDEVNKFKQISIANDNEMLQSQLDLLTSKSKLTDLEKSYKKELESQFAENERVGKQRVDLNELLKAGSEAELARLIKNAGIGEKFQVQTLTLVRDRKTAIQDLSDAQKGLDNEVITGAQNQYKLKMLILEGIKDEVDETGKALISDEEYYRQKIGFEKELLEAQLKRMTNVKESDLTEKQKDDIIELRKQIELLNNELGKIGDTTDKSGNKVDSLNDKFFKMLNGSEKGAKELEKVLVDSFQTTLKAVSDIFNSISEGRIEQINAEMDAIQENIDISEERQEKEQALADEGKANNLARAEQETATLKAQQEEKKKQLKAEEERQAKFAVAQIALNQLMTLSNLALAASLAIAANASVPIVGVAIGLAAAASLVAGFFAIKAKLKGFHDGIESVEGPAGHDNAGVYKLEKNERVINAKDNERMPTIGGKPIKNELVPDLVRAGLSVNNMKTPEQLISIVSNSNNNSNVENWLKKMYYSSQNKEEIITMADGRIMEVLYSNGKISNKKIINC